MADAVVVLTTVPSAEVGAQIARALVEERLAACVNVLPSMTSIYRWQETVQHDLEHQLVIKTLRASVPAVRARVMALHPYELPEFLVMPVEDGDPRYLAWIAGQLDSPRA